MGYKANATSESLKVDATNEWCNPYLTSPPQYCPDGSECRARGSDRCMCGSNNGGQEYCNPYLTSPPQYCPDGSGCPACGSDRCACPYKANAASESLKVDATNEWCNPYLTSPPQYCPDGSECPACGSDRCACPYKANATVMV